VPSCHSRKDATGLRIDCTERARSSSEFSNNSLQNLLTVTICGSLQRLAVLPLGEIPP